MRKRNLVQKKKVITSELSTRCSSFSEAVPLIELFHDVPAIDFLHYIDSILSNTFKMDMKTYNMKYLRLTTHEQVERLRPKECDDRIIPVGLIHNIQGRILAALVLGFQELG